MFAEILLLSFDTCYLLVKYFFQYSLFIQQEQDPTRSINSSESRSSMIYYFEFIFHISTLTIDILHHLQMLFHHQTFMSMSSLIFFMQLKPLFHELTQRLKKHKSYRMAMLKMEKKYPLLTKYDLEQKYLKQNHRSTLDEICSICWEKFDKARCLPCKFTSIARRSISLFHHFYAFVSFRWTFISSKLSSKLVGTRYNVSDLSFIFT